MPAEIVSAIVRVARMAFVRMSTSQKKGATEVAPNLTQIRLWLELEPDAHAHVEGRLELRRVARQLAVDRLTEVGIGRTVVKLRVLVVVGHATLVEQVEDVRDERHTALTGHADRIRRLHVHLTLERRSLHEAIDR